MTAAAACATSVGRDARGGAGRSARGVQRQRGISAASGIHVRASAGLGIVAARVGGRGRGWGWGALARAVEVGEARGIGREIGGGEGLFGRFGRRVERGRRGLRGEGRGVGRGLRGGGDDLYAVDEPGGVGDGGGAGEGEPRGPCAAIDVDELEGLERPDRAIADPGRGFFEAGGVQDRGAVMDECAVGVDGGAGEVVGAGGLDMALPDRGEVVEEGAEAIAAARFIAVLKEVEEPGGRLRGGVRGIRPRNRCGGGKLGDETGADDAVRGARGMGAESLLRLGRGVIRGGGRIAGVREGGVWPRDRGAGGAGGGGGGCGGEAAEEPRDAGRPGEGEDGEARHGGGRAAALDGVGVVLGGAMEFVEGFERALVAGLEPPDADGLALGDERGEAARGLRVAEPVEVGFEGEVEAGGDSLGIGIAGGDGEEELGGR